MRKHKRGLELGGLSFFAGLLIFSGIATLLRGKPGYTNYWGGHVFAPLAIVIGLLLLVIVIAKFRRKDEEVPRKMSGKEKRRARKAEQTKFPIDTFRDPWT